jgi:uncharacterized membrane protein
MNSKSTSIGTLIFLGGWYLVFLFYDYVPLYITEKLELVLNKSLSSVVILLGLILIGLGFILIGVIIFLLWCGLMNLLMKVLLKSKK